MFTTSEYQISRMYKNYSIGDDNSQISWLNLLTFQSIPEEPDIIDYSKRSHTNSDYSSSSTEECYIILENQSSHSIISEQELNFAQINEDIYHVEYEQSAQSMPIETFLIENATEYESEETFPNEQYAKVTDVVIHDCSFNQQSIDHRINSDSIKIDSIQKEQEKSIEETSILTRSFAFDRVCMDKYLKINKPEINIKDQSNFSIHLNPKSSSLLRLIKKRTQTIKSECNLSDNHIQTNEPLLLRMKYFDGRPTLTDLNTLEIFEKSQLLSTSISSRSGYQEHSYRKRILNRLRSFLKS